MTSVLTSRRQHVTWALGGLWLLDGLLQLQPSMFTSDFPTEILRPAGEGSPVWVSAPVAWSSALVKHHLVVLNALFALTQLALGVGIIARRTRKAALLASIGWAVLVWWLGEGFGAMFAGAVSPLMGLPGAVALYALVAVFVWPVEGGRGRSVAAASPLHSAGAAAVWMSLWGLFAVESLMPANRSSSGLHDMVAGMASGEPGWVQSVNLLVAGVLDGRGAEAAVVLAVVFAVVAVGVLAPGRLSKATLVAAVALAAVIWVVGQDFGGLATGRATDPNSGPLLALLAWCYWPTSRSRETQAVPVLKGAGRWTQPRTEPSGRGSAANYLRRCALAPFPQMAVRQEALLVFSHLRKSTCHRALEHQAVLARSGLGLGAGVLAMVVLSACGSSGAPSAGGSAATGSGPTATTTVASPSAPSSSAASATSASPKAEATIHISGFRYTVPASVAPGATVSVMNMDGENHTVTADVGNAFDVKATAGTTVTFTAPKKPGSYPFHCTYHSNMHAVLVVK